MSQNKPFVGQRVIANGYPGTITRVCDDKQAWVLVPRENVSDYLWRVLTAVHGARIIGAHDGLVDMKWRPANE